MLMYRDWSQPGCGINLNQAETVISPFPVFFISSAAGDFLLFNRYFFLFSSLYSSSPSRSCSMVQAKNVILAQWGRDACVRVQRAERINASCHDTQTFIYPFLLDGMTEYMKVFLIKPYLRNINCSLVRCECFTRGVFLFFSDVANSQRKFA